MAEIAVLVPVLNRPANVQPLVNSLTESTDARLIRVVFIASRDDREQIEACQRAGFDPVFRHEPAGPGDYPAKINLGFRWAPEPFSLLGADDLRFHPGWAEAVLDFAREHPGVGVIGTDDLGNPTVRAGKHSTHPVVRRSYIERRGGSLDGPGVVYHEGYGHQGCDTELVELAKARGAWGFCAAAKVEHLHPFWKKGDLDATYRKGQASSRADADLFRRRQRMWRTVAA